MELDQFEDEWKSLKVENDHGSFSYDDPKISFKKTVNKHFRNVSSQMKYGVYVIRQKSTNEVLYIGMSGTINQQGDFKGQDIPGRLKNVKTRDMSADVWVENLMKDRGSLIVEYVFLDKKPKSPGLVETVLLQSFLNEYGHLPYLNNAL